MATTPRNPSEAMFAHMHARRVHLMLRITSVVVMAMGLVWAMVFMQRGDWPIVAVDGVLMLVGALVWFATGRNFIRIAFFVMFTTIFIVVCAISLVLDVPTLGAPRTTHHFLLVLALGVLLFLQDASKVLRQALVALCLLAYMVLACTQIGMVSDYVMPDSMRVWGSWVNGGVAIVTMYALIYIMLNDFVVVSEPERDLRRGIARSEFFLLYQPQVTSDGKVVGAEALLRWLHPQRGLVSPGEFIGTAEQTGLIVPLGLIALEAACQQLVQWARLPGMSKVTLSVNVSAQQFRQDNFVDEVRAILKRTGAPSNALKLELTESLLVHDIEDIVRKMTELKSIGVGFSLDDFGTGYSSLNYLKRLPLDQLKIDQSFVRDVLSDPNDAAIAKTVISLGKSMGFTVIAEGVETEGQRGFLMDNDCHFFQGYLFSKPLPAPLFLEFANGTA